MIEVFNASLPSFSEGDEQTLTRCCCCSCSSGCRCNLSGFQLRLRARLRERQGSARRRSHIAKERKRKRRASALSLSLSLVENECSLDLDDKHKLALLPFLPIPFLCPSFARKRERHTQRDASPLSLALDLSLVNVADQAGGGRSESSDKPFDRSLNQRRRRRGLFFLADLFSSKTFLLSDSPPPRRVGRRLGIRQNDDHDGSFCSSCLLQLLLVGVPRASA